MGFADLPLSPAVAHGGHLGFVVVYCRSLSLSLTRRGLGWSPGLRGGLPLNFLVCGEYLLNLWWLVVDVIVLVEFVVGFSWSVFVDL